MVACMQYANSQTKQVKVKVIVWMMVLHTLIDTTGHPDCPRNLQHCDALATTESIWHCYITVFKSKTVPLRFRQIAK